MSTYAIQTLMDPESHCQDCGALLIEIQGGSICAHCGCEPERWEEEPVLFYQKGAGGVSTGPWMVDDKPQLMIDEAA